jgi:hypothetical protein
MNTERIVEDPFQHGSIVPSDARTTPAEAAEALTSLSSKNNSASKPPDVVDGRRNDQHAQEEEEDDEEEFEFEQRFTKSGRKRAVPFPLKVRLVVNGWTCSPRASYKYEYW